MDRDETQIPTGYLDCVQACRDFVRKVETGRARSVQSYRQMKAALAKVDDHEGRAPNG